MSELVDTENHEVLVTSNMATAPRDMLIAALHPGFCSKNYDVETFMNECNIFINRREIYGNWIYQ